jgi:hypothetical protein
VGARAHHFLLKKSDSLAMFAAIRRASSRVSSFAAVAISLGISFKQLHTYKEALALGHCNKNGRLVSRSKKKFGAPWAGIRGLAAAGLVHTDITKEGSPTNSRPLPQGRGDTIRGVSTGAGFFAMDNQFRHKRTLRVPPLS